jgi:F-type H+-transporting ATPase subunit a
VEQLILASGACDPAADIICKPDNVNDLFEFTRPLFSIGPFDFTRTVFLTFLAMLIVVAVLYFGLHKPRVVPTKFGVMVESIVGFVRDDIARSIIGQEGTRYLPYLLAMFLFILVANLFEITPGVNFPITSRMAIPIFLSLLTWVIFVAVGFFKNGFRYVFDIAWPKSVPVYLRPLVGVIELVSTFLLRPLTLAVRLFANMVAGHMMLTLLLVSGVVFIAQSGFSYKIGVGALWFAFGLGIYLFEIVVAVLQAYIFTLLSAVYIETSLHPQH